jgi:hypothetical protein
LELSSLWLLFRNHLTWSRITGSTYRSAEARTEALADIDGYFVAFANSVPGPIAAAETALPVETVQERQDSAEEP